MERVVVKFNTITPIFTGDAWSESKELKPSAIIGSLRFWFEVYCYFAGIEVKEKEELNYKKFREELEKEFKKDPNQDIDKLSFEIASKMLTLPSLIFGCTGWKSRVEIESIEYLGDYCFGNRLNLPNKICVKKRDDAKGTCPKRSNDYWSVWYLPQPYFYGEFEIIFNTSNEIKEKVLYPLLKYIQKYGFIGSKNNLGYGRVEIIETKLEDKEFDFNEFGESKKITEDIIEKIKKFDTQRLDDKKLHILSLGCRNNDLKYLIEELLTKKAELRRMINDSNERHYTFGFTSRDNNEATKIIPLISKDGENYIGNFLSIVGIRNFGEKI